MPDRDDQNPNAQQPTADNRDGSDSRYNPADLTEAMRIIAALEKRVGEREDAVSQFKERLTAMERAQQDKMHQNGQFEELAQQRAAEIETLKPYRERAEALEGVIRQSNAQRIEQIPEQMRSLVPVEMLSPDQLATWLDKNAALLMRPPAPSLDGGAGSGGTVEVIRLTDEQKRLARSMGISDDEMLAQIRKRTTG